MTKRLDRSWQPHCTKETSDDSLAQVANILAVGLVRLCAGKHGSTSGLGQPKGRDLLAGEGLDVHRQTALSVQRS